jgi:2-dehydro-3-deoxyphosphogluconate aldolase/(4S)-4-hydroxy-2-oxoglutarate aldolase
VVRYDVILAPYNLGWECSRISRSDHESRSDRGFKMMIYYLPKAWGGLGRGESLYFTSIQPTTLRYKRSPRGNLLKQETWLNLLTKYRIIAVIRTPNLTTGIKMATAVAEGGIKLIEITWNSYQPTQLVKELKRELNDCVIGVGTILNIAELEEAIAVGAEFCFSPHYNPQLQQKGIEANLIMIPGALSPTEILQAWQNGASSVKVFPVEAMGGPKYIQSLQGPLGHIPLIPTGGVTLANASDYLKSGAIAVGLARELFPSHLVSSENWLEITQRTHKFCQSLCLNI